jgi:deferrochelatase/peroxidase EfeB
MDQVADPEAGRRKWARETARWESLDVETQERVMGRRKTDSVELDPRPADSHVAKTDQDDFGNAFRRNMPYTKPLTGAYYFIPSVEAIAGFVTREPDG